MLLVLFTPRLTLSLLIGDEKEKDKEKLAGEKSVDKKRQFFFFFLFFFCSRSTVVSVLHSYLLLHCLSPSPLLQYSHLLSNFAQAAFVLTLAFKLTLALALELALFLLLAQPLHLSKPLFLPESRQGKEPKAFNLHLPCTRSCTRTRATTGSSTCRHPLFSTHQSNLLPPFYLDPLHLAPHLHPSKQSPNTFVTSRKEARDILVITPPLRLSKQSPDATFLT